MDLRKVDVLLKTGNLWNALDLIKEKGFKAVKNGRQEKIKKGHLLVSTFGTYVVSKIALTEKQAGTRNLSLVSSKEIANFKSDILLRTDDLLEALAFVRHSSLKAELDEQNKTIKRGHLLKCKRGAYYVQRTSLSNKEAKPRDMRIVPSSVTAAVKAV